MADRARNRRGRPLWLIALVLVIASLALGRFAHADAAPRADEAVDADDLDSAERSELGSEDLDSAERSELDSIDAHDALDSETEALVELAGLDDALVDGTYLDALDLSLDDLEIEPIDTRPASRVGRFDLSLAYRRHDTEQLVLLLATWRL